MANNKQAAAASILLGLNAAIGLAATNRKHQTARKTTRPHKRTRGRPPAAPAPDYELKNAGSQQKKRLRGSSPSRDQEIYHEVYHVKRRSKRLMSQKKPPTIVSIDIPKSLQQNITKSEGGHFELKFPINALDGLRRFAWGLDLRAQSVTVCLKFPPNNSKDADHGLFCVHASTDAEGTHQFCSTKSSADHAIKEPCTSRSNILTIILNRTLYSLMGEKSCRKLDVIHDAIDKILKSDPTESCLICGKAFTVKIYTPTACLGKCMAELEKWPLRARLSHLLSDFKALDFLLCTIYTAVDGQLSQVAYYNTEKSLLVGCPLQLTHIKPTIDSFPALSDKLSMNDMLNRGPSHNSNRRQLLSWLSLRFRGSMVTLGPDAGHRLKGLDGCHQLLVLNARLERQEKFTQNMSKIRSSTVAFHGCRAPRAFNILTDALRDPKNLPYQRSDVGIFFSDSASYSYSYTTWWEHGMYGWKNSHYQGHWSVLFGIEAAKSNLVPRNNEFSTRDESLLMIRYVLLVPWNKAVPPLNLDTIIDKNAMAKAFKSLNRGTLSPQDIGMQAATVASEKKASQSPSVPTK